MFELSETERAVEQMIRKFCEQEIAPRVPALERGDVSAYPLLQKMADAFGMPSMLQESLGRKARRLRAAAAGEPQQEFPGGDSESGNLADDPAIAAIFSKEMARVSPGVCLAAAGSVGCGTTIAARGDADLIERCAIPVLSFRKVGCWALTEPDSGSDAFAMKTTVRIEGDEVVVHGAKTYISNAPDADVFLVYARLDAAAADRSAGGATDKRQIFPVVLERETEGLSTGKPLEKMGMHAAPTGEIFLDQCRVPRSQLLGDPEKPARRAAEETLATERAAIVAMCLGVIERCLEDSLAFATARVQFGRPIASFQLIQQKLANMYVALENVRNLMFKLIWLQRNGRGTEREVSAAKLYATEAASRVALDAVQLMGGAGYMQEYAPERLFRDIKLWTIGGGTSEIQTLTIAKDLLRERGFMIDLTGGFERAI